MQITDVEFGGKNAPPLSKTSDNEKIWLGVGITLAILLVLLVIYLVSGNVVCPTAIIRFTPLPHNFECNSKIISQ